MNQATAETPFLFSRETDTNSRDCDHTHSIGLRGLRGQRHSLGDKGEHLSQALKDTKDGAKPKWAGMEKGREGPLGQWSQTRGRGWPRVWAPPLHGKRDRP